MIPAGIVGFFTSLIVLALPVVILIFLFLTLKRVEKIEEIVTEIKDDAMHVIPHRIAVIEDILRDLKVDMDKDRGSTTLPEKRI